MRKYERKKKKPSDVRMRKHEMILSHSYIHTCKTHVLTHKHTHTNKQQQSQETVASTNMQANVQHTNSRANTGILNTQILFQRQYIILCAARGAERTVGGEAVGGTKKAKKKKQKAEKRTQTIEEIHVIQPSFIITSSIHSFHPQNYYSSVISFSIRT